MSNPEILREIILARRSVMPKDYSGEPIPEDVLQAILSSADYAPNHKKTRPWRFQVFRGAEKASLGEKMAELYRDTTDPSTFLEKKYASITEKASISDTLLSIVVSFSPTLPEWEEIAATAMAVQNMYLTCTAYGVGCYWSSPKITERLDGFLGLDENQRCIGIFYMGMKKQNL